MFFYQIVIVKGKLQHLRKKEKKRRVDLLKTQKFKKKKKNIQRTVEQTD